MEAAADAEPVDALSGIDGNGVVVVVVVSGVGGDDVVVVDN